MAQGDYVMPRHEVLQQALLAMVFWLLMLLFWVHWGCLCLASPAAHV